MNILYIGDIVGRPGRNAVRHLLPTIKSEYNIDLTFANSENLAGGLGMTRETYQEMCDAGIDYFTTGNHIWTKKEFLPYLDDPTINVLRPANYPAADNGRGVGYITFQDKKIQLINLIGKSFMRGPIESYFDAIDTILTTTDADIRIIDFHAEATSEKAILGFYVDGKVTAIVGTHTHVPTADERILPKGTAFQTDLGMTGPINSSLGAKIEPFMHAMRYDTKAEYHVASGPVVFNSTRIMIDDTTNTATSIERIQKIYTP